MGSGWELAFSCLCSYLDGFASLSRRESFATFAAEEEIRVSALTGFCGIARRAGVNKSCFLSRFNFYLTARWAGVAHKKKG